MGNLKIQGLKMNILSINNLRKIGREDDLFNSVTFGLNEGEKAALIGRNGSGKSTLLNTIAGVLKPDDGTIVINKESGFSFLSQNPEYNPDDTIKTHIFKSSSPKLNIIRDFLDTCKSLSTEYTSQIQKKYDALNQKMEELNLWNYESQVSSILETLGLSDLNKKMSELSGGMRKKVFLAQVLVEDTKLLLLDEPTNHLDISTIFWLQNYLHDTTRTVLMVTHDRYFLDAVCTNIFELSRKKIKLYEGNYSEYLEKKSIEVQIEENTERRIESVLRFERDWLSRGPCARGTKAKARIQNDLKLINREKFQKEKGFTFEVKTRRLGGKVLELENISKNFPKGYKKEENPVIKDFNYVFSKGQRIGIFGDNGSGKSTFLNIITGNLESDSGKITKGINTVFGYYNQNPVFKDLNQTVLEYIKETAEFITTNDGKTLSASVFLSEFGFEGKIQYSPVSSLSGGERKKLYLVKLLLQNPNFLILDEPTNDFDIFTMNIMEDFLLHYEGCLLIVSHDRYFMDKICDFLFIMEDDGFISGFTGKCSEYIEYRNEKKREEELKKKTEKKNPVQKEEEKQSKPSVKKMSFKEQKEFENIEKEIEALEKESKILEEKMTETGNNFQNLQEISKKYAETKKLLEEKYSRWDYLSSLL